MLIVVLICADSHVSVYVPYLAILLGTLFFNKKKNTIVARTCPHENILKERG